MHVLDRILENKYISRITSSERGEAFNFLMYPMLLSTFVFALSFAVLKPVFDIPTEDHLYQQMYSLGSAMPVIWGALGIFAIISGLTFLLFRIPPVGKLSGLLGFILWMFAGYCYIASLNFMLLLAIAIPWAVFWGWQYLSLSKFREEEAVDEERRQRKWWLGR